MKKSRLLGVLCACLFAVVYTSSHAALVSRLGGQAYYDTVLDITWLANSNLAETNAFGTAGINANGTMNWHTANTWIANMNADGGTGYLGIDNWRLPTLGPINGTSFDTNLTNDGSTDFGHNVSRPGTVYGGSTASELAHLFYNTLGNVSNFDASGSFVDGCSGLSCLTNTGPFPNLSSDFVLYWFGTSASIGNAWRFDLSSGYQAFNAKNTSQFAVWAVSPGDVAAVPVPAAVWLFGSGLLGLIGVARRKE